MGCTTTTSMYLNISTEICANASTSRSGNTVTVSGTFSVNQPGGYNLNAIYAYVDGQTTWQRVKTANSRSGSANFSFSFQSSSAGSATYSAVFQVWNNAESGPVGGTASTTFSVSWPASGSAPSNGHIDNLKSAYNHANGLIELSADKVGVSSSLTLTNFHFNISNVPYVSGLTSPHQWISCTNEAPVTLNQSNSNAAYGGLTIEGNYLYYSGLYAENSVGSYVYTGQAIVTPCKPADITLVRASDTSVSIYYAIDADGGYYARKIDYSLDGGNNWVTGDTIPNGSSTGVFTVTNLDSYKDYTIQFRVTTPAGSTNSGSISFVLLKPKFYGSVSNLTEKTNKLYGSLSNQSKSIVKFYASENGRAKLIYKEK